MVSLKKLLHLSMLLGAFSAVLIANIWYLSSAVVYAADSDTAAVAGSAKDAPTPPQDSSAVEVIVTEKIPGADCTPYGTWTWVTGKKYKCTVQKGFWSVRSMLAGLIKYATFLTGLIGVLMIVFSGLQYATSAGDTDAQKKSISRITKLVGWLVLLMLTALILNTIAPWIYG